MRTLSWWFERKKQRGLSIVVKPFVFREKRSKVYKEERNRHSRRVFTYFQCPSIISCNVSGLISGGGQRAGSHELSRRRILENEWLKTRRSTLECVLVFFCFFSEVFSFETSNRSEEADAWVGFRVILFLKDKNVSQGNEVDCSKPPNTHGSKNFKTCTHDFPFCSFLPVHLTNSP